ncbi:MotE family protein [Thalassobacillus pellis]|uniref:MotE family protein n=1 Tax=Thalassobacillus pellis TaxID=748008 RepID=UPI0019620672|nr:hypothetical protein [Thalassobacillus pellis]MBM7552748.1 flagellar motility protein MotE (MotC chaperone) [Thalassobacillus pellis]
MAKSSYEDTKSTNKLLWFTFAVIIPVAFAILLAIIVMTIAGINVGDQVSKYTKNIPGISSIFSEEEKPAIEQSTGKSRELEQKEQVIMQLEETLSGKTAMVEDLEQQVKDLEAKLEAAKNTEEENKEESLQMISSSFKDIDPEEAAPIFAKLDKQIAVKVLGNMPPGERGAVFAAMEPELAAELTSLIIEKN